MKRPILSRENLIIGAICGSSMLMPHAHSQIEWTGGSGDYDAGTNWDSGEVPAASEGIGISAGTATKSGNLERAADSLLNGGELVIQSGRFLNARGGPADFTLSDGSLQQTGNYFIIGQNNAGTFSQSGGSVSADVDRGFFISDGAGQSSNLAIEGGSFSATHNGTYNTDLHNTWLGRGGQNDQVLINGGDFSVTNTAPGPSDRRFYLSGDSTFQVDSGTATISDMRFVIVGRTRTPGTSNFVINGGQTNIGVNTAFIVGGGQDGSMSITNGTIDISQVGGAGGDFWIDDGGTTSSAIVSQSGGMMTVGGEVLIGRTDGTTATYTMTGGQLHAGAITTGSHSNPLFEFLGGDIFLEGDQTSVISETWFQGAPGTAAAYDGGSDQTHIFVVPEPSALAFLGLGSLAFGLFRRR